MIRQLTPRERWALGAAAVTVLAVAVWLGMVESCRQASARLDARIAGGERRLQEVEALRDEVLLLKRKLARAERGRGGDFSLFAYLETLTKQAGLGENLLSLRPLTVPARGAFLEEAVEIRLERIRLSQLVRLTYAIDAAEDAFLQVKALRVKKRFDNRALLDVSLNVSHYVRGG